jgi:hypothetical protein
MTGGEPMLDVKSMRIFLNEIIVCDFIKYIRIDTNLSWRSSWFEGIDTKKVVLMCSLHPSQTDEDAFLKRINEVRSNNYRIGMVNYVMSRDNIKDYMRLKKLLLKVGIPLHPNPLWDYRGVYSEEDLKLLKSELPTLDYCMRTGQKNPHKEMCLFPGISYEMDFHGNIHVGCHPFLRGKFRDKQLPVLNYLPTNCPRKKCTCLDMYSFLSGVNRNNSLDPLGEYSKILLHHYRQIASVAP